MRKLIKDSENNVMELVSLNGFIPDGFTEVAVEDISTEELSLARKNKMAEIRSKRDAMLLVNDKVWIIASKTSASVTNIETDAATLRDMTIDAQTDIDSLTTVEDIKAYDAFAGLTLSRSYE